MIAVNRYYMEREFDKYARLHCGISSMTLHRYESAADAYINPTVIEERKLNVASMDVFSRDPSLRMNELATMSGFNAVASFNISFRAFMNESPGDWSRKYRESIMGGKRQ